MEKSFLAGVFDVAIFEGNTLVANSKTLINSSLTTEVSLEDIRAGKGAKLWGRYAHSSSLNLELEDVLFNMDYIAWNVGSAITSTGATLDNVADVLVGKSNKIEVKGTPANFLSYGKIGWFTPRGTEDWTLFTFDKEQKTATLPSQTKSGVKVQQGDIICVKYPNDKACDEVIVNANFIPSEVTLVLSGDLFKASSSGKIGDVTSASKIGKVEVEIPRFQLNGAVNLQLEMTGASNTPLSGTALATSDGLSCEDGGYYAKIKKCYFNDDWREKVSALVAEGGNTVTIGKTAKLPLNIYAVIPSTKTSKLVSPVDLTYTPSGSGISVVEGVINTTGSAVSGSIKVELKANDVTYATTTVTVTVTE